MHPMRAAGGTTRDWGAAVKMGCQAARRHTPVRHKKHVVGCK